MHDKQPALSTTIINILLVLGSIWQITSTNKSQTVKSVAEDTGLY